MPDEYWAYEKAEFERHKHDLEVSRPETLRYQDALRELLDLVGNLFEHLDCAADIEAEREAVKARCAELQARLDACDRILQAKGGVKL